MPKEVKNVAWKLSLVLKIDVRNLSKSVFAENNFIQLIQAKG